ncbi:hypothetical protein BV898_11682 [Hypsibius exemplaris]|uniref:Uncharacterized protein n=1 Tax=Hypsibius exemplaris TaxID=2072580 RepID=A0A1W0WFZ5_HYPEX|nr:hypothetical protein BV898_11682 [Hypsibius exemplaris]
MNLFCVAIPKKQIPSLKFLLSLGVFVVFAASLVFVGQTNFQMQPQQMMQQQMPQQMPQSNLFNTNGRAIAPIAYNNRPLTMGQRPTKERNPDLRNVYTRAVPLI